jgi:hypothetical protein
MNSGDRELPECGGIGRSDRFITSDIVDIQFSDAFLFDIAMKKRGEPRSTFRMGTFYLINKGG